MQKNLREPELNEVSPNTVSFGPCAMDTRVWKRLKIMVRTLDASTNLCFAILGKVKDNITIISDLIEHNYQFTADQIRKLEKEAAKQGLLFIGLLYVHRDSNPTPLEHELAYWISLMFKLNRPLLYFVISTESSKVAAYTIPPETFFQLKDAIKLVIFEC
jgi:hypothetical protein